MRHLAFVLGLGLFILPQGASASDISLIDLKLDIGDMSGEEVTVEGKLSLMGDLAMLTDPSQPVDSNPIPVSIDKLSRDDRKFILSECSLGCDVKISGKVGTVFFSARRRG